MYTCRDTGSRDIDIMCVPVLIRVAETVMQCVCICRDTVRRNSNIRCVRVVIQLAEIVILFVYL